jgi:hypothetical protein
MVCEFARRLLHIFGVLLQGSHRLQLSGKNRFINTFNGSLRDECLNCIGLLDGSRLGAWLQSFRCLKIRSERYAHVHKAFLSIACSLIGWGRLTPFIN